VNNLNDATEKICDLKGSVVALDALITALLHELPPAQREGLLRRFAGHTEVARTVMLHTTISEHTLSAFERDVGRFKSLISSQPALLANAGTADGSDHTE
jgi:hypothetical protein